MLLAGALLLAACSRTALGVPQSQARTPQDASTQTAAADAGAHSSPSDAATLTPDATAFDAAPVQMCPAPPAVATDSVLLTRWKTALGTAYGIPMDLALDASGNAYVVGEEFEASSTGGPDAFIAKLGVDGSIAWIHRYGDGGWQSVTGIALSPNGDVVVVGTFSGTIDFAHEADNALDAGEATALTARSTMAAFVAKFDPDGHPLWSRVLDPDAYAVSKPDVAVDTQGRIVVANNELTYAAPTSRARIQALDANGRDRWTRNYPGAEIDRVAVDASGAIIAAGAFLQWSIELGSVDGSDDAGVGETLGNLPSTQSLWLLQLDSSGIRQWSQVYVAADDAKQERATDIALDPAGNIYLGGVFSRLGVAGARNDKDGFVAKFAVTGEPLWTRRFDGDNGQFVEHIAVTLDSVALTGSYEGELQTASERGLSHLLGPDAHPVFFAARLSSDGEPLWAGKLGGSLVELGTAVAVDPSSSAIVLAGVAASTLDKRAPVSTAGNVVATGTYNSPMVVMSLSSAQPTTRSTLTQPGGQSAAASAGWHDDLLDTLQLPSGTLVLVRVRVDQPSALRGFGWIARAAAADAGTPETEVGLGLYQDFWNGMASRPGPLLAQTSVVRSVAEAGRVEAEVDSCINLAPGYYWIGLLSRSPRAIASGSAAHPAFAWGGSTSNTGTGARITLPLTAFPEDVRFGSFFAVNVYALLK